MVVVNETRLSHCASLVTRSLNARYRPLKRYLFKVRKALEVAEPLIDFIMSQPAHSFSPKLLDVERGHHRSKNHRAPQRPLVQLFLAREITHQAAGESVACAGRIKNRLQRVSGNREVLVFGKHGGTIFSAFYDQRLRSPGKNLARCLN